mgnify:CR=1 FL=1
MKKCDREILETFDATGSAHPAAQIVGVNPKVVRRYVAARGAGRPLNAPVAQSKSIDPFMGKFEELVESKRDRHASSVSDCFSARTR